MYFGILFLFVSLVIYKSFTVKQIIPFLGNAVKTYAPLCFVLAFAIAFGRVLALAKAPILIENFILNNFSSGTSVLTGIVVIFLLLGNGYGYRACHSYTITHLTSCCSVTGSEPGAFWRNNGMLPVHWTCNPAIWIGPIRCRNIIRYSSDERG
jgi:hypothetical protein